ncbi:hypothetical protein MLD38_032796 [Melastoma candidum]|uniref:Uncharacterized protein n=1 Tax=Melastoma candidum TaxID=119954 RepID=A0ACB9M533_9MYRT|nr:hypothetical protein MLD38_032796 [Melastoma candidum]
MPTIRGSLSAAKPFKAPTVAPQDLPVDYSGFIAVVFGIAGVMFPYKLSSWLAIIFCVQSLVNMRNIETDLKQKFSVESTSLACLSNSLQISLPDSELFDSCNARFAIMGLVTNYFRPARHTPQK